MANEDLKKGLSKQLTGKTPVAEAAKKPEQKIADYLAQIKPELQRAMPKHVTAERLTRIALTTIRMNPKLLECTIPSLLGAVMQAAQLGLEPSVLGQAYLVPFNNRRTGRMEVQLIVGYQGLIELFYRSGRVETVFASEVREMDKFDFVYGITEDLKHKPFDGERGKITYFYAYAKMRDGGYRFVVLPKSEVDKIRDTYSKAKASGPWVTNYEEMGCKTAIRALAKWLPKSVEIMDAISSDEGIKSDPFAEVIKPDTGEVVDIVKSGDPQDEAETNSEKSPAAANAVKEPAKTEPVNSPSKTTVHTGEPEKPLKIPNGMSLKEVTERLDGSKPANGFKKTEDIDFGG